MVSEDFTDIKQPPNIVLSESFFQSGFSAFEYCLCRRSPEVVTAAAALGLIPSDYKVNDFLDTNPLFCLSSYRPTLEESSLFSAALQWRR